MYERPRTTPLEYTPPPPQNKRYRNYSRAELEAAEATKNKGEGFSRREMLAGMLGIAGAAAGSVALGTGVDKGVSKIAQAWKKVEDFRERTKEPLTGSDQPQTAGIRTQAGNYAPTETQAMIIQREQESIKNMIAFDRPDRIELKPDALCRNWEARYQQDPKLRNSLVNGFYEMGAWEPYVRQIFKEEDVPERLVYLALAESHWDVRAVSPSKAVGPFQFMKDMAGKPPCNLVMNSNQDERYDILKSARACARLLKDNFNKLNHDWNLAVAAYNGGFVWKFASFARTHGIEVNYKNFLAYTEDDINRIRDEIRNLPPFIYKVAKNETIRQIASKFGHDIAELTALNRLLPGQNLKQGQKLRIPYTEKQKQKKYEHEMSGYYENLTYPEKCNAIINLLDSGFAKEQKPRLEFDEVKIPPGRKIWTTETYVIRKGDTLPNLAKRFHVEISRIKLLNKLRIRKIDDALPTHKKLLIPVQNVKYLTIKQVADRIGIDPKELINKYNQSYNSPSSIITDNKIKVPKIYG